MAAFRFSFLFCVLCTLPFLIKCLPEPGKITMKLNKNHMFSIFPKSLYKDAVVSVKGSCKSKSDTPPRIKIAWKLKYSKCGGRFVAIKESYYPAVWRMEKNHEIVGYSIVDCKPHIVLQDFSSAKEYIEPTNSTVAPTTVGKVKKNKQSDKPLKKTEKAAVQGNVVAAKKKAALKKTDAPEKETVRQKRTPGLEEMLLSIQRRDVNTHDDDSRALIRVKRTATDDSEEDSQADANLDEDNHIPPKKTSATVVPKPAAKADVNLDEDNHEPPKKTSATVVPKPAAKATDTEETHAAQKPDPKIKKAEQPTPQKVKKNPQAKGKNTNRVVTARRSGIYLFIVNAKAEGEDAEFNLELEVSMKSDSGFLSAADWPLLPFYGVMSLVYLFYGIVWLIVSACQWRDLLRIQFWIGGVIALGMLEKAVFYSEYNNINNTGVPTSSLVVFAELVSVLKRTLARMLVVIVSMGFGIVKPRLGSSLHRVLGVGALYFILGTVEGSFRSLSHKADPSKQQLIASIPLAVLDAAICWWIFMSLVQTTRTLRIRRNVIKLSLYRHFTNTLIFAVLASVAYMIWSIKTHKFADCIRDWSELWLDDAFWHFLFSIILLVIMILWRPTANNQRYAFTPLVDFGDDEDDEDNMTLSEAFEGMKNRNNPKGTEVSNGDSRKKVDDDLKWVEENIPTSAADTVLPSVLDSDEELMTTKFEMSKME